MGVLDDHHFIIVTFIKNIPRHNYLCSILSWHGSNHISIWQPIWLNKFDFMVSCKHVSATEILSLKSQIKCWSCNKNNNKQGRLIMHMFKLIFWPRHNNLNSCWTSILCLLSSICISVSVVWSVLYTFNQWHIYWF